MNRFHIITNSMKDPDHHYTDMVADTLKAHGAVQVTCGSKIPDDAGAILVLGGDGTLLRAAGDTFGSDIPLLGINLGTLGYMAEVDISGLDEAAELLIHDDYMIEDRMMLCGSVDHMEDGTAKLTEDHCLNDVAVTGSGTLCMIRYELYVNGEFLNSYAADGLVIATPTGSTGYNMSAGGPVVEPRASLIVVTPICPHTLNTRSIVLSAEDVITVRISDSQTEPVAVQFDGREPSWLRAGDTVRVGKSEQCTRILKLHRESFLKTLHEKLV